MMPEGFVGVSRPLYPALLVYAIGVVVALIAIDARGPARLGLALLWPVGPIAFIVTITILLAASLIAFPWIGAVVLALALGAAAILWR
jgi:hypothetical protein